MRTLVAFVATIVLALALFPDNTCSLAHAQSTVAVTQFKEGKKLYDDGKFEDALQLFQLAWEHSHSPNARLYIARSFKELGKVKPAYDEFRGTLRDATERIEEDNKYKGTQAAAAAELVLLEPKIAHLIISLDVGDAKDAKVTLNGETFPQVSLGSVVTVLPGTMKIVASAAGKADVTREFVLSGGKTEAVALYFPPDAAVAAPKPDAPADQAKWEPSTLQLVGLIVGGVGVAGLLAAGGTGIAAGSKFGALEAACGDGPCTDPGYNEIIDEGQTLEVVTYIMLGVGGAAALTGAALWIFGGDAPEEEAASTAKVVPIVAPLPGGVFLGAAASF